MSSASVVAAPVLPAPAVLGPPQTVAGAPQVGSVAARTMARSARWPEPPRSGPISASRVTAVEGFGGLWPAVEVTLTGVPSVPEPGGGFPDGPVDGYPHPTSYRLVPDSPAGPMLILPLGLWGDQPATIFADVSRRGFDVDVKAGSRRVGREQHLVLRRHGGGSF